jgi:hypothetical protein
MSHHVKASYWEKSLGHDKGMKSYFHGYLILGHDRGIRRTA